MGKRLNTGRTHFKIGHIPWNKGTKGVMVAWNKTNTVVNCEVCGSIIKTSPCRIGRKKYCSKKCLYSSRLGHIPWNKGLVGKYHLKNEKFSEAQKKKWARRSLDERKAIGKKISKAKIGFRFSDESKLKMRKAQLGKKQPEELVIRRITAMRKFFSTKQPTSIETKLYEELKSRGLLFETQKYVGGRFIVDAYIPSLNLIIEADGNYWHSLEKAQKRDKLKDKYLRELGFNILRLSETEINDGSFKERIIK